MPVPVHEAGEHGAAVEIEHGLRRGRVDLRPPAAEDDAAVAEKQGIGNGGGRRETVRHGIDPRIGEQHPSMMGPISPARQGPRARLRYPGSRNFP